MKKKKQLSLGSGIHSVEGNSWKFNKNVANSFDKHVRQSIPFYDQMQNFICSISEWFLKDESIIYDLGCSTGETAKNIKNYNFNRNVNFKYVGLDNSDQMINLAKKKFKLKKLQAGHWEKNIASRKVLLKNKFKLEGILKSQIQTKKGRVDRYLYGLII